MAELDMEKGELKPEGITVMLGVHAPRHDGLPESKTSEVSSERETSRHNSSRRRNIGFLIAGLIALGLIVGLSIGLTHQYDNPSPSSPKEGGESQQEATTTGNAPSSDSKSQQNQPVFQSKNKAFNVSMNLLSPAILEGYSDQNELRADLGQAVRFYINNFIEDEIRWGRSWCDEYPLPTLTMKSMKSKDNSKSKGKSKSAAEITDFQTNVQVDGVDEADLVKSDGTYVFAAYGDTLVVWEAATGSYVTNYTLPSPSSDLDSGDDSWRPYQTARISGLLLEGNHLVLFAGGYGSYTSQHLAERNITSACVDDAYATRVLVFETSPVLRLVTSKDIHGSYRDARAFGTDIHLVTTCSFDFYSLTTSLYISSDTFVNMTDDEYRIAAAETAEPLIDDFVELMIADINAHGTANIPKVSLWGSQFGNNTATIELANSGGAIQAFTRLTSFSIANLHDELSFSNAGACTASEWGYTYAVDGWAVFAAEGWQWNEELEGTSEFTHLLGFRIEGGNATPAILGSMPGRIINQYALSIHQGHLRAATSIQNWIPEELTLATNSTNNSSSATGSLTPDNEDSPWSAITQITKNQVIILKIPTEQGEMFEEVSRISDLGQGDDTINAINYFGLTAYVGEW